ncbi:MAG: hypothetical protein OEL88_11280 [Sterolibacteriaceae bacterium MAG5]|nr:hypothetical protein [Candidatus Nitricoxidireducens bremensis]
MNPHDCAALAERLNAGCQCSSLDRERLRAELEHESPGFYAEVMEGRPHLFSAAMVFVGARHGRRMAEIVTAIERVVALSAYRDHVLAWAPEIARTDSRARSVFLGYDFHLGEHGPRLIEINTNAGGGLLNAILARAQQACCDEVRAVLPGDLGGDTPEHLFMEMFRAEWAACRGDAPLRAIAIVDDDPAAQYLHPEFVLFQRLFARHGIKALVCDPQDLMHCHGSLWVEETRIDLVYNRLTDFALEEPAHAALRLAWLDDAAVVTPHPRAHALYADKRNLVALSDDALLASWGVDAETRTVLTAGIPRTERVAAERADDFWARRKQLFFKPAAGYGSKAAYRGDKITKRVFDEVLAGNYIAQALVPPSSRRLEVDGEAVELKLDLRNYVYNGHVQLVAARLWQGQTTNFRTPGGGFAPVLTVSPAKEPA